MSFNIRVPVDQPPNDWDSRKSVVVDLLNSSQPDIVGFQELVEGQKHYLSQQLSNYTFIGSGREQDGTGESVSLFINRDKWTIDDAQQGTFWFSDTPDLAGSAHWGNQYLRICTWVRLVNKLTGNGIYIFNNHWDFSAQFQTKAANLLVNKIEQVKYANEPVVIIGDFNASPDSQAIKMLNRYHYKDAWLTSRPLNEADNNLGATFHGFTGIADSRIDYLFYNANILNMHSFTVHQQNIEGIWPSDHFPISAVFNF